MKWWHWSRPRSQTNVVAEAKQWLSKHDGQLTLHWHRLKVDSVALRRKWQNLVRPRSEILQDSAFTDLLQRELAQGYDVLHLEQMSTGWLGLDVPRALLNVHYFDVIDRAGRENMSLAGAQSIVAGAARHQVSSPWDRKRSGAYTTAERDRRVDQSGGPLLGGSSRPRSCVV